MDRREDIVVQHDFDAGRAQHRRKRPPDWGATRCEGARGFLPSVMAPPFPTDEDVPSVQTQLSGNLWISTGASVPGSQRSKSRMAAGCSPRLARARSQIATRSAIASAWRTCETTTMPRQGKSHSPNSVSCVNEDQVGFGFETLADGRIGQASLAERDEVLGVEPALAKPPHQREREILVEKEPHEALATAGGKWAAT